MLKYKPRVYLIKGKINIDTYIENRPQKSTSRQFAFSVNDSNVTEMVSHKVFEFEELEFMAVTAYQVKKVSLVHSKNIKFRIR